jgi:hypothetical protein
MPAPEAPLESVVDMTTLNPCFDRQALTDAIERWLERSTVDARLRVHVSTDAGVPSFSIRLGDDAPLVRTFEERPKDCDAERDTVALSIALAIDALSSATPRSRDPVFKLGVSGLVTTPWPNTVNWGAATSLRAQLFQHFEPEFALLFAASGEQSLTERGAASPARFDARLILARASACFTTDLFQATTAIACAGLTAGPSTVSASGLVDSRSETRMWWAATGTVELRFRLTSAFGLHVGADVMAALRRGTLRVENTAGQPVSVEAFPGVLGVFRVGPTAFF